MWEWLVQKAQVDFGNVLVAFVAFLVMFASLRQTRRSLDQERELWDLSHKRSESATRYDRDWTQAKELVREIANLLVEIQACRLESSSPEQILYENPIAQGSLRISVLRRAKYLQLRLSSQVQSENAIRDAIQGVLGTLDGASPTEAWHAEANLEGAVRKYVETLSAQIEKGSS